MRLMDEENMMFDELESRKKWLKEIKVLFNEADTDQSGQINWSEFYAVMTDFQAQTCLKHLGFDTSRVTAQQLWNLIDYEWVLYMADVISVWSFLALLFCNLWGHLDAFLRFPIVHDLDSLFALKQLFLLFT
eukprot:g28761.t1